VTVFTVRVGEHNFNVIIIIIIIIIIINLDITTEVPTIKKKIITVIPVTVRLSTLE